MLGPNQVYSICIKYDGHSALVLRSPDDDERDLMVRENNAEPLKVPPPPKKVLPRKIYSISDTPLVLPKNDIVQNVEVADGIVPNPILTPIPTVSTSSGVVTPNRPQEVPAKEQVTVEAPVDSSPTIAQMTKVSTGESGQKGMNPIYFAIVLGLSLVFGAIQWIRKNKN